MKIKYIGRKREKRVLGEPELRGVVFKRGEPVEVKEEIGKKLLRFDVFEKVGEQLRIEVNEAGKKKGK